MLLVSGCSADFLSGQSTPDSVPTVTPTPLPGADGTAQAYLAAWQTGDYDRMYSLLTPPSQVQLPRETFKRFYLQPLREATVTRVGAQLRALLHQDKTATADFFTSWETLLFGTIEANNRMRLQFLDNRWGVTWQPTLVLPQLGHGVNLSFLSVQPTRGNIYDRNFHALATQGDMVTVGIIPQRLDAEQNATGHVSRITGVSIERIDAAIAASQPDWFVPVAEIDFETSLSYDNLFNSLLGVERRTHEVRMYNDGETASHIVGYMGPMPAEDKLAYLERGYSGDEVVGLSGLEKWAEFDLAGKRGGRLVALTSSRTVQAEIGTATAQAGSSLYVTFDTAFQVTVESLLGEQLGAVVVMDADTGALHALASYPRFEPARFSAGFDSNAWAEIYANADRPLVNRAAQGAYPPASIFKIVTLAAALESLQVDPSQSYFCQGHWYGLGPQFGKDCWLKTGHGNINLIDGLTQSCDVVFYELGLALHRTDPQLLPDWARKFGLGEPTNLVGLPEHGGVVPDSAWKRAALSQAFFDGDAVNSAIGQGYMLATPLQITRMMAAIANNGHLVQPRVVDRIVSIDGVEQTFQSESAPLSLSAETMTLIQNSLRDVTSGVQGTARRAFEGFPYEVAGKTGTAESGQEDPHAWFSGYIPTQNGSAVVITVIVEHAGEGSAVAAPIFRQVAEAYLAWEATRANPESGG